MHKIRKSCGAHSDNNARAIRPKNKGECNITEHAEVPLIRQRQRGRSKQVRVGQLLQEVVVGQKVLLKAIFFLKWFAEGGPRTGLLFYTAALLLDRVIAKQSCYHETHPSSKMTPFRIKMVAMVEVAKIAADRSSGTAAKETQSPAKFCASESSPFCSGLTSAVWRC